LNPTLKQLSTSPQILERWQENLPPLQSGLLKAEETDRALELFEVPSIVSRTCQHVTGNPSYNKCLISYCMDGDIKLLTVQEETFSARALIRIIFDEEKEPILLMEPIYKAESKEALRAEEMLKQLGKQKARHLGIPLFQRNLDTKTPYKGSFRYLGGSCESTYSDLLGGVCKSEKLHVSILNLEQVDLTKD
jgi:hypothetical protein